MAARGLARLRSAALALALAVSWSACGHDTLVLLPGEEDASTGAADQNRLDGGSAVPDADTDAGTDASGVDGFPGHDGYGGSSGQYPYGFDAGMETGNQGGAPGCDGDFCGGCAAGDTACLRCLYVSCEFKPSQECLDRWLALGCSECSEDVPCQDPTESCHPASNQCRPSCTTSSDCTTGSARKCENEDGVCVECLGDSDCCPGGDDCGRVCHQGTCFQCSSDSDCRPGEICVAGGCLECLDNSMCPGYWPYCIQGTCHQCVRSEDCYPGETCNAFGSCY